MEGKGGTKRKESQYRVKFLRTATEEMGNLGSSSYGGKWAFGETGEEGGILE